MLLLLKNNCSKKKLIWNKEMANNKEIPDDIICIKLSLKTYNYGNKTCWFFKNLFSA